jgi:hypothetical protein
MYFKNYKKCLRIQMYVVKLITFEVTHHMVVMISASVLITILVNIKLSSRRLNISCLMFKISVFFYNNAAHQVIFDSHVENTCMTQSGEVKHLHDPIRRGKTLA